MLNFLTRELKVQFTSYYLLALGALLPLFLSKSSKFASYCGCFFVTISLICDFIYRITNQSQVVTSLPIYIDVVFLLPIFIIGIAASFHSLGYLKGHGENRSGFYWFLYSLTILSMILVINNIGTNFLIFLVFWEIMGLTSGGLVAFDYDSETTKHASYIYMIVSHIGAAFLILANYCLPHSNLLYLAPYFYIIGFGLKAGLPLLHIWLPEAHPAAPAPVSALMSGAMINIGIFGIYKYVYLAKPSATVSSVLIILGCIGALGGIMFAMGQKNIKKLLAFSSIENIGIITIGLALSCLASSAKTFDTQSNMHLFAIAGMLLHIVNHSLLKGGLFLGAGSIFKATHSLNMEDMGGLLKKLPKTGTCFLLNSVGISGLPPLNAFLSELLLYVSIFYGIISGVTHITILSIIACIALALTGGLATACFTKLFGAVFLGEPRNQVLYEKSHETTPTMYAPIIVLSVLSLVVTLFAFVLIDCIFGKEIQLTESYLSIKSILKYMAIFNAIFIALSAAFYFIKEKIILKNRVTTIAPTWDCGFAKPTARMQYTGSAFIQPLVDFLKPLLGSKKKISDINHLFPTESSFSVETDDVILSRFWTPIFKFFTRLADKAHILQAGYLHLYILIMVIAIVAMLIYGFCFN